MVMRSIELIGAAIGEGAADPRTRLGPGSLRRWGLGGRLSARGRKVGWGAMVRSDRGLLQDGPMAVVREFTPRLADAVAEVCRRGVMPVVVGGDHSCAVGTWSGVAAAIPGPLGLLWIDAHMDSHTPETSDTLNPHGMPLAALLGHGDAALVGTGGFAPKLRPQDVVLVGTRSYEAGEAALLERLGVRVMHADEVASRGLADCLVEAVTRLETRCAAWGISFDLDALDPEDAPGTGVPVDGGMRLVEVLDALHGLAVQPRLAALELVEYNPMLDVRRETAAAAEAVLRALIDRRAPAQAGVAARASRSRTAAQAGASGGASSSSRP